MVRRLQGAHRHGSPLQRREVQSGHVLLDADTTIQDEVSPLRSVLRHTHGPEEPRLCDTVGRAAQRAALGHGRQRADSHRGARGHQAHAARSHVQPGAREQRQEQGGQAHAHSARARGGQKRLEGRLQAQLDDARHLTSKCLFLFNLHI